MLADRFLDRLPLLKKIRGSPATIWATSSILLFIDTFIYALTVADLPDILQDNMHVSPSSNGIVTTMFGVGAIVGSIIAAAISDRFQTRLRLQILASFVYTTAGVVLYLASHYYQLLLFRLINGVASGIACTMLYTTVGDVYPSNLLGFKVAIICFFNNIGYTIGPICGQKLFNLNGIPGIASIVIALGIFELLMLVLFVDDSLKMKSRAASYETHQHPLSGNSITIQSPRPSTIHATCASVERDKRCPATHHTASLSRESTDTVNSEDDIKGKGMSMWNLIMRIPVLVSTAAIITAISIQCTLEGIVPLHLEDQFSRSDNGGITFVIFGLALTILVPVIGKASDWFIGKFGEHCRYYVMLFGAIITIVSMTLMGLAKSYAVLMVGYVLFAFSNLCLFVPAQSAYGDFVNYAKSNSMARCYAISVLAWSVSAIALPPIGTALYATAGFTTPLIVMTTILCVVCAGGCLIIPIRKFLLERRASRNADIVG